MTLNPDLRNRLAKTVHDATCGGVCFKEHPARYLTAADKAAELLTDQPAPNDDTDMHEPSYRQGYTTGRRDAEQAARAILPAVDIDGDLIPADELVPYAKKLRAHLNEAERSLKELAIAAPPPAPSVLPTVEEVARAICEPDGNAVEGDHEYHLTAARAALDLIASRIRHWGDPVAPGTVVKKGTRYRAESDVEAYELTAMRDWTVPEENTRRVYIDAATVPAPEDPAVAAVIDWWRGSIEPMATDKDAARDLLARIDAVRGTES